MSTLEGLEKNAARRDIASDYATHPGVFDEMKDEKGLLRAHWGDLVKELSAGDEASYMRRLVSARRTVRDNGVTYNVYDDAGGEARPWDLDILPLLVGAQDWARLEAGITQRARLMNALLDDVYGPRALIREGAIPPHVIAGHPRFLRPLAGVVPAGGVRVHFYSADVGRRADGSWVVLSERADAPSGSGYALENRIVVSQTFPELFRDCRVRRLAAFFHAYREAVSGLASDARMRSVLLTPGPYNESYFEHAYLARYLGLTLVEGEDLAVRDGIVYLKTLSGLERVDVIYRRVDSDFCDPVELRSDSALGVPGLVEAARNGKVIIANALGGGVAEGPWLAAFEHRLCQALLGEPLALPGVRTMWLGTRDARRAALAEGGDFLYRDAFDNRPLSCKGVNVRLASTLDRAARDAFAIQLERRGGMFVAQEIAPLATAPVYDSGRLTPRPVALRVFAAWTPNGYIVMPGGLTRVAHDDGTRAPSLQSGAASKDTWVLTDGPVDRFSLLAPASERLRIRRMGDEAPSRAMDNLFWLGRYAERAEELVRVARAVVLRLGDDAGIDAPSNAADMTQRLLVPLSQATSAAADAAAHGDMVPLAGELHSLVYDPSNTVGLQRMLNNVYRTAWSVRDRLSPDTWRTTLAFCTFENLPEPGDEPDPAGILTYLDMLVRRSAALAGLSAENMTRGRNWLFLELGRRIERASNMSWLLQQTLGAPGGDDEARLPLSLEIADSTMTYRYRYLGVYQAAPVLDLLLLDDSNPRAVAFQIATLKARTADLPRANSAQARGLDKEIVDAMLGRLRGAEPGRLAAIAKTGRRDDLLDVIAYLQDALGALTDAVTRTYFQHSVRFRTGSAPRREFR